MRCGSTERLGLDHIVPVSKGGEDSLENLRVYCLSCNARKGAGSDAPLPPEVQEQLEQLKLAIQERHAAESEYIEAMIEARKRGYGYAEIARAAGISRQAAREALTRRAH